MSQIVKLVAANPGWVSIFESSTGQRTYRPIAAFALTKDDSGENHLRPYSGDPFTDDLREGFAGYEYSPHIVQELVRASGH